MEAVNTAAQLLVILVDIPHCRADAAAAGAVAALATLLKPVAEDAVSATEEVPSVTSSFRCTSGVGELVAIPLDGVPGKFVSALG